MPAAKRLKAAPAPGSPDAEPESTDDSAIGHSLLDELFGEGFFKLPPVKMYLALPPEKRQLLLVVGVAAALFLPMLGQFGLWDPWETHFGEVGREMLARHDWVHPWWERVWFFSKPPLTMWLDNIGLWLSGAEPTVRNQEMGGYAEWGMRLPTTILSIAAIGMIYLAAKRLFSQRVGLIAALATATSPLYCILARQTITDTPFVAFLTIGMCCFLIAEFDPEVKARAPWLYGFYASIGLATLAKEIPFGIGIPGAVVLGYILLTWDWMLLTRVRLFTGAALTLVIALPWVVWMAFFKEIEEEGETFNHRYWLHDNFSRLLSGVHTTRPTRRGPTTSSSSATGCTPGARSSRPRSRPPPDSTARSRGPQEALRGPWALVPFVVISLSATKFEHYAFPCFPPLAILVAIYLEQIWHDGLRPHTFNLLLSGGLFAMIGQAIFNRPKILTEMFTYNPERPYPNNLIADPTPVITALFIAGGVTVLLSLMTGGKGKGKMWGRPRWAWASWSTSPRTWGRRAGPRPTRQVGAQGHHGRHLLARRRARRQRGGGRDARLVLGGGRRLRRRLLRIPVVGALGAAVAHWTQRQIMHTYYTQRLPGEPLGAYLMNWKGETFYTKNEVRQMQQPQKLEEFLREPAGPQNRHWVITDTRYYKNFQQQMTNEGHRITMKDDSSVKFFLVTVE